MTYHVALRALRFCTLAAAVGLLALQTTSAQTAGDPGANVNIVGPTPDPADIRDVGLKQQNEPSCAIRPGDSACIICGFNDYRTVDVPLIADAWQGVAMSCDAGTTWTSRVAPGHPIHPSPIGTEFAADPRMIALPGMAIFNFIGGDRDQNNGVLAIQHWLEVNKEDADFYEPGRDTVIADVGSSGRFIDKPDAVALLDLPGDQGTISLSTVMENPELGTITRSFPTGKLFVAFAVFTGNQDGTGNQSVKVLVKDSDDWGKTWTNQTQKLSEDQNTVSGISLTAMGDSVLAVWRRAGDNNDFDSIMYAYTNNRGRRWTKAKVLADICSFDQISATTPTAVTFRTNDFPWAANDGKNFYVFYSDRNYDGNSDCTLGRPRIVMKHASSGAGLGNSPLTPINDPGDGSFQFMPAAFGANGKVQVAWYDTRREEIPVAGSPPVIADYVGASGQVNRQVDVYTTRITSDSAGNNISISDPVRVSQFRIRAVLEAGTIGETAIEGEASFANAKLYASGSLSFIGDYIAVAGQQFRFDGDGKVISNATPIVSPAADNTDFFVAWADNRDVRGNIFDPTSLENTVPYSPPVNNPASTDNASEPAGKPDPVETAPVLLANQPSEVAELTGKTRTTEGLEDPFNPMPDVCVPGIAQDRTRNANIYGARIRDQVRLTAPTPTKPLTNLQRAFPIALSNANSTEQSYRLRITRQPIDAIADTGRASFRQLPAVPPFDGAPAPDIEEDITVPPKSALARTVFLVSNIPSATTEIQAFELTCDAEGECTVGSAVASVTLGGEGPSGPLQQPNYESTVCDPTDTGCSEDVLQAELHNPELINPELINPELINPELINPELINPELINPELINPELINPELINLGFANPELINPELINPELINPELINPELINPELINPELINSSFVDDNNTVTLDEGLTWTDYTYIVRNTGNVTTSYNADITLSGTAADDVDSQLVAWTLYITPTSRDCDYKPQVERRVLATVNNPDDEMNGEELEVATIDAPFEGEISAIAAPGQTLFFTRRVFGTLDELETLSVSGFTTSSQAANCSQTDKPAGNTDDYFCQVIEEDRELILLDTQPPTFSVPDNSVVPVPAIAADRPGGACVAIAGVYVTAEDNGELVDVTCTDGTGQPICTTGEAAAGESSIPFSLPGELGAMISCTAVDDAGNIGQVNLLFDVRDTGDPEFTAFPTTISVDAGADGFASFDFQDGVGIEIADLDDIDSVVSFSCVADTPEEQGPNDPLPVGATTIDCTVSDRSGNETTQSFVVQVNDVTPPEFINIPLPDFDVDATDPAGATVTYVIPDAADAGSGVTSIDCAPPPGTVFEIGVTTVTCTATDASGNSTSASFEVTVVDAVPPVVAVPIGTVEVERQSVAGAVVDFSALVSATDNIDPSPTLACTPQSGSLFPAGTTTVTCTATDTVGNAASDSFDVRVEDTTDPVITSAPSGTIEVERANTAGATYSYSVTASDSADPSPSIVCTPPGFDFGPGMTTVTCTATDSEGNSVSTSFTVNVIDTTAPMITSAPSGTINVERETLGGAMFSYTVTASDSADPSPSIICTPPGFEFGPGMTTVTCIATDNEGNSASTIFVVNVDDTTAPSITAPSATITAEQQSPAGATVNYSVTATDTADPAPIVACTLPSGSVFPAGLTTVTCTATDNEGNSTSASFDVSVVDTTPPILTVPSSGIDADLQNAAGTSVDFSDLVTAVDSADSSPAIVCTPASGSLFPAGATTVACTATDDGGNSSSASFEVRVGYADAFGIDPKKLNVRGGSSNPLSWGWLDSNGAILNTSYDEQLLEFRECDSSMPMFTLAGDPGSSGFKIKADNSWEYNWQSDGENGAPLDPGFYCVRVTSELTGQFLESPPIRVR